MSLSVFHYNIVFAACRSHFPASTHLCVFCRQFFCLMSLLQGMLKKGDFRVSAFGPNLKNRRRMSTTGTLTHFHPIPAWGPWMVSLWYNLQHEVWAGVWVWIILSVGFVSSHFEPLAPSTIIYFDSHHRWVSRFKIWTWNASRMMLGEKNRPKNGLAYWRIFDKEIDPRTCFRG